MEQTLGCHHWGATTNPGVGWVPLVTGVLVGGCLGAQINANIPIGLLPAFAQGKQKGSAGNAGTKKLSGAREGIEYPVKRKQLPLYPCMRSRQGSIFLA